MKNKKKLWTALLLIALAVAGMTCLTQCKQPQEQPGKPGEPVAVEEQTEAEIIVKDEDALEADDNVVDFGGEDGATEPADLTEPTAAPTEAPGPEETKAEETVPSAGETTAPEEATEVPGAKPGSPDGYGDFF